MKAFIKDCLNLLAPQTYQLNDKRFQMRSPSARQADIMRKTIFTAENLERQDRYFAAMGYMPGEAIIDVGANIGYLTVLYTILFPDAEIAALEPSAANFRYLKENTKSFPNILPLNFGAHHEETVLTLSMPSAKQNPKAAKPDQQRNSGLLSLYGQGGPKGERVTLKRLDDILAIQPLRKKIGFIKIDVEGNELNVLLGAQRTISEHSPAVEVEVNPDTRTMSGTEWGRIREFFARLGYEPYTFGALTMAHYKSSVVTETVNMVFIKDWEEKNLK